ncbi:MAG: 6-phosphofructokinase [Bacteroidales bacterium]|nr:6-phosphofructokinase [Bacteroidales bacterium]
MNQNNPSIAIICGGGPAPGINTVLSTLAKLFIKEGYRVLGIHHAYKGLFSTDPQIVNFNFELADSIFNRGGSVLYMDRFKPKNEDFNTDFFVKHKVKLLVTIGGDDTASTAVRVSEYLKEQNIDVATIHVPKTIDNDLPLPDRNPTFGFHSAKDQGVKLGNIIAEDARTTQSWYVLSAMGRTAGHLAFGIAASCHFPMMIIPEMFDKTKPTFERIIDLVISSIVKRKIENIHYGVVIISEGVFHIIDNDEIKSLGINFSYDAHGHPELGNVSKSEVFNSLLQKRLVSLGLEIKSRPTDIGYELRCCRPIGFDLTLCTLLASGVVRLFKDGKSGCIVTANSNGDITPLYLNDIQDETGKVVPRLVNINSDFARLCFENLDYLKLNDSEKAVEYLPNPEKYVLNNILNWN